MRKVPMSAVPAPVMMEVGLAMLEGALKYGRHNFRKTKIRHSVYYDAFKRHIEAWWEGEDIDPKSNLHHITKLIAGAVVLRDSIMRGMDIDDRPPKSAPGWMEELDRKAAELMDMYPDPEPAVTEISLRQTKKAEPGGPA